MPDIIQLDQGSGGRASQRLIRDIFLKHFSNDHLARMDDAAVLDLSGPLAISTDAFTVDPIIFPGGDIGCLAVNGTINDVAMAGAVPAYLTCSYILEEGLELDLLDRIVASMARAAQEAGVLIVAGDTKVVPKGAADRLFITTTGIGQVIVSPPPSGSAAKPGDAVIISGDLADHGLVIMTCRADFGLKSDLKSDCAALNRPVESLLRAVKPIHVLRDPTRGGLATTLNEIASQSGMAILLDEASLPVKNGVSSMCVILGLDPLYLANEGKFICILPEDQADTALKILRRDPLCANATRIGTVLSPDDALDSGPGRSGYCLKPGQVLMRTTLGGLRPLNMLEGHPLPRIC